MEIAAASGTALHYPHKLDKSADKSPRSGVWAWRCTCKPKQSSKNGGKTAMGEEKLEKHCNRWIVVSALCTFTFCFDICEFIRACRLSLSPMPSNLLLIFLPGGMTRCSSLSASQICLPPGCQSPISDIRQKTIKRMQIELKTIKLKMELCILCHSLEKGFFSLTLSFSLFLSLTVSRL